MTIEDLNSQIMRLTSSRQQLSRVKSTSGQPIKQIIKQKSIHIEIDESEQDIIAQNQSLDIDLAAKQRSKLVKTSRNSSNYKSKLQVVPKSIPVSSRHYENSQSNAKTNSSVVNTSSTKAPAVIKKAQICSDRGSYNAHQYATTRLSSKNQHKDAII